VRGIILVKSIEIKQTYIKIQVLLDLGYLYVPINSKNIEYMIISNS